MTNEFVISPFSHSEPREFPLPEEKVLGFDIDTKEWVKVQYRADSNRFFDYPYMGSVYPLVRMYKWKRLTDED